MAKKSRRSSSRKIKRTQSRKSHARKTHRRRTHRRGGADALDGAPVSYHLSGSWPSRMSLGQGADYFKYHEGQHGGASLSYGAFPAAVLDPGLPAPLRGPAHLDGIDKAIADVRPLKDQGGGRRKHRKHGKTHKGSKKHRKGSKKHHKGSKKHHKKGRKTHKRRGGSLGYAPFPSSGMLLSSPKQYAQAGLNPEWKTDIAFTDAKIRDTQ